MCRRLPWWLSGKESCQCRRPGFVPWVGKTPWRRAWQTDMTEQLSTPPPDTHTHTHTHVCCCCLVAQLFPTLCDPMDWSPPGSSPGKFSRQEYWSGLPCPHPGDIPDPGMEPRSPALRVVSLPSQPPGKAIHIYTHIYGFNILLSMAVPISNVAWNAG